MKRNDDELDLERHRGNTDKRLLIPIIVVVLLLAAVIGTLVFLNRKGKSVEENKVTSSTEESGNSKEVETMAGAASADSHDLEDPQNAAKSMSAETGANVDMGALRSAGTVLETEGTTLGVDVAKYQGTIDWQQVAASGIEFAMIRVGYRTQKTGEICEDSNAKYNMQEAQANGIKIGAYFFSSAISKEEAVEEAEWVSEYIARYQITYPVAFNCEGFGESESRQYSLTQEERTDIAITFLDEVYKHGYTPMFYASRNEMLGDAKWDTSRLEQSYKIWVSQYPAVTYPDAATPDYTGAHAMWQYTNKGSVPGISEPVDLDVAYFGYEGTAGARSDEAPETAAADVEALMKFTEVNETVTAKEKVNLRDIPSQGEGSKVIASLANGASALRTGVSDSGWSRIEYDGKTCYAVSSYLTSDLNYQSAGTEGAGSGDGLKTKFTEVNDTVTAKIEVNLRALPSVTNPDAAVIATLHNGENVTRTGINEEYGWSRVEYSGQVLYCISSYVTTVQ